jgi:hypothetical protein
MRPYPKASPHSVFGMANTAGGGTNDRGQRQVSRKEHRQHALLVAPAALATYLPKSWAISPVMWNPSDQAWAVWSNRNVHSDLTTGSRWLRSQPTPDGS